MARVVLADTKEVADYGNPYFVAEVNSSHNGSVEVAKSMIDAAIQCGCDCVKFQSWSSKSLYSQTYYNANPIAKRFVDKFSLKPSELAELATYCKKGGVSFSSTPYSEEEVDFLVDECSIPFIKIASMELNNIPFLQYIGNKGLPIVLSTGMGELKEIDNAIKAIESTGNKKIVLLHCVSVYPTEPENVHLNNIVMLRERFPMYPIGFSDHTIGSTVAIGAVTLGAALLEKHMTLDKKKIGMDNQMAMEPDELSHMISECKIIHRALGKKERILTEEEIVQRKNMRRSIVAKKTILKGEIIKEGDICFKRPGDGIPPCDIDKVIGRIALCNIDENTVIYEASIK